MRFGSKMVHVQQYGRALRQPYKRTWKDVLLFRKRSPVLILEYDDEWFKKKRIVQKACNECERFDQCLKEEFKITRTHWVREHLYNESQKRINNLIFSLLSR